MVDPQWVQWISSSIFQYFSTAVSAITLPGPLLFFPEGVAISNSDVDRVEFRIEGPDFDEYAKDSFQINVTFDALLVTIKDPTSPLKNDILRGKLASLFVTNIPIYRYGYDNSLWLCLTREDKVRTMPYGFIESTNPVLFSTVEASYYVKGAF